MSRFIDDQANKWYRPIGVSHGSDYIAWQAYISETMGPDFIGYLEVKTTDKYRPRYTGKNIRTMSFVFFNRE